MERNGLTVCLPTAPLRKAHRTSMRAVVVDESGFSTDRDVPIPVPEPGEILVKILACGMCGSDLHVFEGDPNYAWVKERFPLIMGHEMVGRRASAVAGDGTSAMEANLVVVRPRTEDQGNGSPVRIGWDRDGAFAEFVTAPEECVYDLSPEVDVRSAALCEPLAVAVSALRRSGAWERLGRNLRVQVVGMGAVGILAACVLAAEGCENVEVVGTERDRRLGSFSLLEEFGLVPVSPDHANGGRDLVVNAAGSAVAVQDGVGRLGQRGGFLNIALGVGDVTLNVDLLTRREAAIVNSYGSEPIDWERSIDYVNRGAVKPASIISHTVPLEQIERGFELLQNGDARKVLVDISMED